MSNTTPLTPALFLDRDGTVIIDKVYLSDPNGVELIDGAADAIASVNRLGWLVVIVSNQSGIARGYYTETDCDAVNAEVLSRLSAAGARVDAVYYCPYHKDGIVEKYARESNDRKPAPGMAIRAAAEHSIDLSSSWMIGDRAVNIRFAVNAGMRGAALVETGQGDSPDNQAAVDALIAQTLSVRIIRSKSIADAVRRLIECAT